MSIVLITLATWVAMLLLVLCLCRAGRTDEMLELEWTGAEPGLEAERQLV